MADQYRDSCVDRQNLNRGAEDIIRLSFFDKDGTRVDNITRKEATCIASSNPQQLFYLQDSNGYQKELQINEVNALKLVDLLPPAPPCPSNPQLCGTPKVQFFGGVGLGAMANAIVSPNSKSIIGFDIVNRGFNYLNPPFANIIDDCGNGSGASLFVQTQPYGTSGITTNVGVTTSENGKGGLEVKNIVITSPGNGYPAAPDGSLGGNGRVWKGPNDGYVITKNGSLYVVPGGNVPPNLPPEDIFVPPQPQVPSQQPSAPTYPVVLQLDEIYIVDPGFGYQPGDTLEVVPNNGAQIEPIINDRGEISQIKVINSGIGFTDLPEILVNSPTGYNLKLIPVLKSIPLAEIPDPTVVPPGTPVVHVVDCVGKIAPKSTFDIVPR